MSARLAPAIVPMGTVSRPGTRAAAFVPYGEGDAAFTDRLADLLADDDDDVLAAYVSDEASVSYPRLRDGLAAHSRRAALCTLEGEIPAAQVPGLERQLPALTRGEGVLDCAFGRYQEVRGAIPERPRADRGPLNRKEYLLRVTRKAAGR